MLHPPHSCKWYALATSFALLMRIKRLGSLLLRTVMRGEFESGIHAVNLEGDIDSVLYNFFF